MKIIAVKTLDGRVLETFKRPIEWHSDAWLDVTVRPGLPEVTFTEVILVGANDEQRRVPYLERDLPPASYLEKIWKERVSRRRQWKVVLIFVSLAVFARLVAGFSNLVTLIIAMGAALALHFSYEAQGLRERLERIEKTVEEQGRVPGEIEQPEPYLRPPLSPEEYENFERIERGREPRRPVWLTIIDWISH